MCHSKIARTDGMNAQKENPETICRRLFFRLGFLLIIFAAENVFAFPIIQNQTGSQSVSSNTTVEFAVQVAQEKAAPPVSVQWRRNGANIPGALTNFTSGSGVSRLIITNAQPTDAGIYYAVVFDQDGAINSGDMELTISNLAAVALTNTYAQRVIFNNAKISSSSGGANNIKASKEKGEPDIGGKPGGASVWMGWVAPASGIARFDTRGSDFDTTLGVFVRNERLKVDSVTNLIPVVGDDDSGGYFNSSVAFNAVAGQEYEIGVDGFYGAQGNIVLNWSVSQSSGQIPVITNQPQSVTVSSGGNASFSVNSIPNAHYQWYLNGSPISEATQSSLTISNVKPPDVGEYQALVYFLDPIQLVFSQPAQLQINAEGNVNSAAEPKFRTEADATIGPELIIHPNAAPVSGFSGTHIYNTYGAASEPGEPNHCGVAGGAPYWFSYLAPADGILTVDAYTPTFTNVLAAYTWPGGDFSTLASAGCASTNSGVGHEVIRIPASKGTTYYLVVDGRNGAVGQVTLTYGLTNPPTPPSITTQPQSQTVAQGGNVTLTVAASGTSPIFYQWRTNALELKAQTNTFLTVSNFQSSSQGNYDVVATNSVGSVTSSVAMLYLNSPVRFGNYRFDSANAFNATLFGVANTNYVIDASSNLVNWIPIATNNSPFGIIYITDMNTQNSLNKFYRAVPQ